MKVRTNSKNLSSIIVSNNEYINFDTTIYTYNKSFIASQLRYVRIKCYDENNNLIGNYQMTNSNNFIGFFDKKNKHFVVYANTAGNATYTTEVDLYNVDHITLQNPENNRYYGFSLFY